MNMEEGVQLRDLRSIVRRRLPLATTVAGAVFLLSIVIAAWWPNSYLATATILVEPQAVSARLIEAGLEESDLTQRLNFMTMQIMSRSRLSDIIDDFGLYPEESEEMTREEVIALMREDIFVLPVLPELQADPRTVNRDFQITTFQISYQSEKQHMAANVANRLANDFKTRHIEERVQLSTDTSEFIEAELERLTNRIRDNEAQIATVKTENVGSLPEDMHSNQKMLERILERIGIARQDLAQAQSDEAFFRQQVANAGAATGDEESDPQSRLDSLQISVGNMRARGYTEKHPDLIAAETEIAALKVQIAAESDPEARKDEPLNIAQRSAEAERLRARLRIDAAQEMIDSLLAEEIELQERLAQTPRVAEQLEALEREHLYLSDKFREFSDKRLEAGVAAGVERRQKGEQILILEQAVAPPEPSSPNRPLILAIGLILGLALGGGVALLAETADSSFHGARQLQDTFKIPVLAAIPRIALESDARALFRKRMRIAFAAAVVVILVLGSSVFGWWWNQRGPSDNEVAPAARTQVRGGTG